jgi:hypothetical protein
MRLLFGIVLGAALTVTAAYIHDSMQASTPGMPARNLVNWDVASKVANDTTRNVREQVDKLSK